MNKEEIFEKFEKNVAYLKRNVPPDDIYMFAEQTFMAAFFFIKKWSEHVCVTEECEKSLVVRKWLYNIVLLEYLKDEGIDVQLDLDLERMEE